MDTCEMPYSCLLLLCNQQAVPTRRSCCYSCCCPLLSARFRFLRTCRASNGETIKIQQVLIKTTLCECAGPAFRLRGFIHAHTSYQARHKRRRSGGRHWHIYIYFIRRDADSIAAARQLEGRKTRVTCQRGRWEPKGRTRRRRRKGAECR